MKIVIDFLTDLRENNNREWFEANRGRYEEANQRFNTFAQQLIAGISTFDPTVGALTLKDVTYRIYRDLRFARDKQPYKTHMGVYVARGGKKGGYAGYYIHLEPSADTQFGGHLLSSGLYMPDAKTLRSVREEILDNDTGVVAAMERAKGFELSTENKLVRTPTGFESGSQYDELLKQKDLHLVKKIDDNFILQPRLAERIVELLEPTKEFIVLINRAVTYAHEEM